MLILIMLMFDIGHATMKLCHRLETIIKIFQRLLAIYTFSKITLERIWLKVRVVTNFTVLFPMRERNTYPSSMQDVGKSILCMWP